MNFIQETSFAGKLLLAMPKMSNQPFNRAVVYICVHNQDGAMGIVVNRYANFITFSQLLSELKIDKDEHVVEGIPIHYGGPVEANRGFVLHTNDYTHETTLKISPGISLSATLETLDTIAHGEGPEKCIVALGYAAWGPGQLEEELKNNAWIPVSADERLLFDTEVQEKYENAFKSLGVNADMLSEDSGNA